MNAPAELVNVGTLDRATYIGGGDAAAIMGVSQYRTPLDVYLRLTGQAPVLPPDPEQQKRFRRGKLMEPVVLQMMREDFGIEVVATNQRYVHPVYPFIATEIDFEWRDGDAYCNGEIKTVHPFASGKWGQVETEEVPIEHAAQSMLGLAVTGRDLCQYGVLFGTDNLALYHVLRDDETITNMVALMVSFWNDHVLARVPPAPRTADDLRKLWPKPTRDAIEASPEIIAVLAEHQSLGREIAVRTECRDELAFQIGQFVKDHVGVITAGGESVATYKAQSRETIDGKALRAASPDVYAQFARSTEFRVLRHATRKG